MDKSKYTDEQLDEISEQFKENASNAKSPEEALAFIRQVLRAKPTDFEVQVQILLTDDSLSLSTKLNKLDEALKAEEKRLAKKGYFEEYMGEFYLALETRPYIRVLRTKIDMLHSLSRTRAAMETAEYLLKLNENDNLGVRSMLISLYAELIMLDEAEAYMKANGREKYNMDDPLMLFPLGVLYYRVGDYRKSRSCFQKVISRNKYLFEEIHKQISDKDYLLESPDFFSPGSVEEARLILDENLTLIACCMPSLLNFFRENGYMK